MEKEGQARSNVRYSILAVSEFTMHTENVPSVQYMYCILQYSLKSVVNIPFWTYYLKKKKTTEGSLEKLACGDISAKLQKSTNTQFPAVSSWNVVAVKHLQVYSCSHRLWLQEQMTD